MVSTLNISSYIKKANALGPEEVNELTNSIKENAWCSAYHILLAKAHHNEDSFLYNKYLKKASVYSGEREVLFNLIHNQKNKSVVETTPIVKPESAIESDAKEPVSAVEEVKETEVKPEVEKQIEIAEQVEIGSKSTQEVKEEVDINSEELVESRTKETKQPKIDFDEIVKYNPLEELKDQVQEITKEERIEVPFEQVIYNPELELQKLIEEEEVAEETGEQDFLYWLNHVEDDEKKKKPEEIKHPERVQNLLDQFLATKRKRRLKTREFYKAETKVEESETDNMDVLSETLVKLYVTQGHYNKAIAAYKKLSLQNPSKSAYFAARIREIEENLK